MTAVSVAVMGPLDEPEYAALVARAPGSPFSHSLAYRDVLAASGLGQPLYLLARTGGLVRAAMPGFVQRSTLGGVYNSLPLVQSAGGCIFCPAAQAPERLLLAETLLKAMAEIAARGDIKVCVVIGTPYAEVGVEATAMRPDFSLNRTTHLLHLRESPGLHHAAKQALAKAERFGPVHRVAETLAEAKLVWGLYAQNMERINVKPRGWEFYEQLYLRAGGHVRFVWAEVGGEPASGLVLLCHRDVVDYHSVGNTPHGRHMQTASWLCVQELAHARAHGAVWWNWGVSPTPAVATFKRSFGGQDQRYPIWGFCTGDVEPWKRLSPTALSQHFPDHFMLPYEWLNKGVFA